MKHLTAFDVQENDQTIGSLMRIPSVGYVFSYNESYVKQGGHELCVTMPLDQTSYFYEELPPYFTNVLSEGWLNAVQNEHINRCFLSEDVNNLGVVAHFGQSCFGALTFKKRVEDAVKRKDEGPRSGAEDDFAVLAEAVGCGEHAMIPGAYPKVLAVASETEPDAFRIARVGEDSTHIAKLFHKEARLMGVLGNEYVATQIVRHLLPDDEVCELFFAKLEGAEDKALLIKRFDRGPKGERLPFYEFNQLLGKANVEKYDGSYGEMADYIYEHAGPDGKNGIKCVLGDVRKLFRRVLVDLLIGNTDAHFKNFALAKQNGLFRLTPNYDKVSCVMFSENRHERYVSVALDVGGKTVRNINEVDSKRLILMACEFQLTPEELVADVRAIKSRLVTLDPVIDAASKVDLASAKHLRDCVRKRWNGAFDQIEGALVKSKPKNNYADKTSRKEAEKAWEEKVGRPVLIRSPADVGRFTL